jgi:hypothetical protein
MRGGGRDSQLPIATGKLPSLPETFAAICFIESTSFPSASRRCEEVRADDWLTRDPQTYPSSQNVLRRLRSMYQRQGAYSAMTASIQAR